MTVKKRPEDLVGPGRPSGVTPEMVAKLEMAFCCDAKPGQAYHFAGFNKDQYYYWLEQNPEFADKIEVLRSSLAMRAKFQLAKGIQNDTEGELSLKYLSKREADQYSEKSVNELQGPGGTALGVVVLPEKNPPK